MPSKESKIIYDAYSKLNALHAARPDMDLSELRMNFESLTFCTAEPTDVTYEEIDAGGVPALWAKPIGAPNDRVILFLHGGGFVLLSPSSHRKLAGHLAKAANARALIPDYRRAPEDMFPAQVEDCAATYRWLLNQGVKPRNIATAGDSAGGNLAITTVLKLRFDDIPLPAAIVGFSPWLDMEHKSGTLESNAATDALISMSGVQHMQLAALGPDGDVTNPLINPLYADCTGLPPMYLTCGTVEALQDDTLRFAKLAKNAGVEVILHEAEGMQHCYVLMAGRAPEADSLVADVGKFLREKLGG